MPSVSPGVAWGPPPVRGRPARVTVLSGPSGVGKTRLADAYAHQCIADGWPLVLRLSATDEISLLVGLDQVAESLGAWDAGSDVSRTVPAALTLLRDHPGPVLMVYDDAPGMDLVHRWRPYFGAIHVVVTTRAAVPGAVELGGHPPADVPPDLAGLAARVDHHPEALAIAAATCGPGRRFPAPDDHPGTDVVRLAHESLSPEVYWLLECLAVLAPCGIDPRLLGGKPPLDVPPALATVTADRVTLTNLVRHAIAARGRELGRADTVLTHVAGALARMAKRIDGSRAAAAELALHLQAAFLHSDTATAKTRKRLVHLRSKSTDLLLRSHNTSAVDTLGPAVLTDATFVHGNIAHGDLVFAHATLKRARDALGYPADTLRAARDQVAAATRVLGPWHSETLDRRVTLGIVLRRQYAFEDALAVHAALLADCRAALDADHPDTLEAQYQVAVDHRLLGRLDESEPLLEHTYAARLRILGPHHVATCYTGESLALDWLETGRVDEGIQLLSRVLADQLASAAPVPDCIANIEHNLADAYRLTGRHAEAKALYQRCIAGYPRGGVAELMARGGLAALR
ncbi:tetratricopeptide repeat protein [Dactylosporangium sp. NPDC049742]|uniref:tetratricopeptide repeat protein n=1 Tax=Dactylosporangium sp. NPDC049742 TaxID=3154737 RepID=UPI00343E25F8